MCVPSNTTLLCCFWLASFEHAQASYPGLYLLAPGFHSYIGHGRQSSGTICVSVFLFCTFLSCSFSFMQYNDNDDNYEKKNRVQLMFVSNKSHYITRQTPKILHEVTLPLSAGLIAQNVSLFLLLKTLPFETFISQ